MCGILGSINVELNGADLEVIRHRGPDAAGSMEFEVGEHKVSFFHARLSIVDLSESGAQPMYSFDKKSCIIFNGEIYNHRELRSSLPNILFRGHSDTESIVNYLQEHGVVEGLRSLNGIFSLAFFDIASSALYLARDRFGVKPLYYYVNGSRVLFASEIRPIRQHLDSKIDIGSLSNCLQMRYTPSPNTIFCEIKKAEPGQVIKIELAREINVIRTYFLAPPKNLGGVKRESQKILNIYGDLFEKAVEKQLMSDVEIGVLLSGGIDSALIAAIAKNKLNKPIKAFTIGFDGENSSIDEIPYARETADLLRLEHFSYKIGFQEFLNAITRISNIVEEPIATTSIIPMYFLAELAASKVKVVLSGQGADEPLAGYVKYKALPILRATRHLSPLLRKVALGRDFGIKHENLRRIIAAIRNPDPIRSFMSFSAISTTQDILALINPHLRGVFASALVRQRDFYYELWKEKSPKNAPLDSLFLYNDVRTSLSDDLLMYTDKITMNFGLECRVPILDNDLIEFIESLHRKHKFSFLHGKIIHKKFAQAYLPEVIVGRKKSDFNSPTNSWFRKNVQLLEEFLFRNKGFLLVFDKAEVKNLLQQHENGLNLEKQIFLLLNIAHLLDENSEAAYDLVEAGGLENFKKASV